MSEPVNNLEWLDKALLPLKLYIQHDNSLKPIDPEKCYIEAKQAITAKINEMLISELEYLYAIRTDDINVIAREIKNRLAELRKRKDEVLGLNKGGSNEL